MNLPNRNARPQHGFTLVEMLVVIAIIGILAGILLPTIAVVRTKARIAQAKMEMGQIENAVAAYLSQYGRMPLSITAAQGGADFTFGTLNTGGYGVVTNAGVATYQTNNAELVAILMDLTTYRNGANTVNFGHSRNPNKVVFLDGKQVNGPRPGIDENGLYRDPWGNPYFITLDGDGDGQVYDGFYRNQSVSQQNLQKGYDGLFNSVTPNGSSDNFAIRKKVVVWSMGPDGKAALLDDSNNAIKSDGGGLVGGLKVMNSDNVLSWK